MSQNKMSEKKRDYAVGRGKTANTTRSALIAAAELAAAHRLGIWDSVMLA
jgi:predicted nucleic acid-binding protein